MYCSKCGSQINEGSKFCPKCGAEISRAEAKRTSKPRKKRKTWIIICLCIGIVALTASVFAFKYFSEEKMTIIGEYKSETKDHCYLWVYEDNSFFIWMNDDYGWGTYEQMDDNQWVMSAEMYTYDLDATITEQGNLYLTSEDTRWNPEIYDRQINDTPADEKIDLADAIDEEWEIFKKGLPDEDCENMQVVNDYGDGGYLSGNDNMYVEIEEDGKIGVVEICNFESNFCIRGVYVGQDYDEAKKVLEKNKIELNFEDNISDTDEFYEIRSDWESEDMDFYVLVRKNKVFDISVFG